MGKINNNNYHSNFLNESIDASKVITKEKIVEKFEKKEFYLMKKKNIT